mgnify:CR=1 FL=1
MNHLIAKIDEIIEERSLLKHPFYQMWTDGKLTIDSLAGYSKEYFQLVKAVPTFVDSILSQPSEYEISTISSHKKEEQEHIEPWIKFAGELGISQEELIQYNGREKTRRAISELSTLMNDSFE